MKKGYAELFRSNSQVHQAEDDRLKEAIARVTGLAKNDKVVGYIKSTFNVLKEFVDDPNASIDNRQTVSADDDPVEVSEPEPYKAGLTNLGLQYNINLVLPQANNIEVYDLIFKSLRENILDWSI